MDMSVWSVKCCNLDHAEASKACQKVGTSLKAKGHEAAVEFRMHFPEQYPAEPPFVYVHSPKIHGGHIHGHGAMCLDVLHNSGWTPATNVASLMRTIRSDVDNMVLYPDWMKADGTLRHNSAEAARKNASWISSAHSNWRERQGEPHSVGQAAKRARVR